MMLSMLLKLQGILAHSSSGSCQLRWGNISIQVRARLRSHANPTGLSCKHISHTLNWTGFAKQKSTRFGFSKKAGTDYQKLHLAKHISQSLLQANANDGQLRWFVRRFQTRAGAQS